MKLKQIVLTLLLMNLYSSQGFSINEPEFVKHEWINKTTGGQVWLYVPEKGQKPFPVIIVPPAGTRLFHGIKLSQGDEAEHIPYLSAGFAVLSFDISGQIPENPKSEQAIIDGVQVFLERKAGILDVIDAIKIVEKANLNLNTQELYVAGHSSAGTLALMIGKEIENIKAIVTYAPVFNLDNYLSSVKNLFSSMPEFSSQLLERSPHTNLNQYKSPVFVFYSIDDENIISQKKDMDMFLSGLSEYGIKVGHERTFSGGHYYSMIEEGIPLAIKWLKEMRQEEEYSGQHITN